MKVGIQTLLTGVNRLRDVLARLSLAALRQNVRGLADHPEIGHVEPGIAGHVRAA